MYNLLHTEDTVKNVGFDVLPEDLQIKISHAFEDYKQGSYITHDQMKHKIQQWLMK